MRSSYVCSEGFYSGLQNNQVEKYAFDEVYTIYWKKLFTIAYNMLNEKQEAEDIVHDVFVSFWMNRNKTEVTSIENYLATAVKYMVLTKLKKKKNERAYIKSISSDETSDTFIESSLHNKHILETVKNKIEELPEKCKVIFKYSRNEGMPVKKIAEQLSISPKTVENQLNKALKQLRFAMRSLLGAALLIHIGIFY